MIRIKKTRNAHLIIDIRVVLREFLAFEYLFILFSKTNQMIIYIVHQKS